MKYKLINTLIFLSDIVQVKFYYGISPQSKMYGSENSVMYSICPLEFFSLLM